MIKRPWVLRETDDEQQRPLDLRIWGDALGAAKEAAQRKFYRAISDAAFEIPSITDLMKSGLTAIEAIRRHDADMAKMQAKKRWILEDEPYHLAAEAALQGTTLSWDQTRQLIWERDGGVGHVCGEEMEWQEYECGHIIDRVVGGADRQSNLVCMGIVCHRLKPLIETRAESMAWARQGGPAMEMAKSVLESLKKEGKLAEVMEGFGSYPTLEAQQPLPPCNPWRYKVF